MIALTLLFVAAAWAGNTVNVPLKRVLSTRGAVVTYVADVYLGTPPQKFVMSVDSQAQNLWLYDKTCSACDDYCTFLGGLLFCGMDDCAYCSCSSSPKKLEKTCAGKAMYDSSKSSTYEDQQENLVISNVGIGVLSEDVIKFGGLTATQVGFALENILEPSQVDNPFDAVFPIGPGKNAEGSVSTPYADIQLENGLENQLGFYIDKSGGVLTMGGADPTKYTGEFTYFRHEIPSPIWQYDIDSISINGKRMGSSGGTGYPETAQQFIGVPQDIFNDIIAELGGTLEPVSGLYKVDCDSDKLVDITFTMVGKDFPITKGDYVLGGGKSSCYLGFKVDSSFRLGNCFQTAWYHLFDFSNDRVGLAKALISQ